MADLTKYLEAYKPKIDERLGKNAPAFTSALASVYSGKEQIDADTGEVIDTEATANEAD